MPVDPFKPGLSLLGVSPLSSVSVAKTMDMKSGTSSSIVIATTRLLLG